ncbi:MAG: hypothetical protein ACW99Q_00870, partial [Candidatus Kariarchaeaceae archaeon]
MKQFHIFIIFLLLTSQISAFADSSDNVNVEEYFPSSSLNQVDDINTGTIGTMSYSYGYKSVDQSFDLLLSGSRTFTDHKENTREFERTINLIVGFNIVDVYWHRYYNKSSQDPTSDWVEEPNLKTNRTGVFGVWYRYNLVELGLNGSMWWQAMYSGGP